MAWKVGDSTSDSLVVTEEMIKLFAQASGDFNPVHLDEEYAKKTRFGGRIAHGMLLAGFISRVMAMKLEGGGIYLGQTLKFLKPVYIGDQIKIEVTLTSYHEKRGLATAETIITNQNGDKVVKGEATIMSATKI